jgi:formylglycine-generating enzyme required for sulfatase activity
MRVQRGGSWTYQARHVRSACHDGVPETYGTTYNSFRPVAKALPPDRVLRNGSWFDGAENVHCADRLVRCANHRTKCWGFRPVAKETS